MKLCEETLALKRRSSAPDHPDTLVNMNNLANSYDDAGQTDRALQLREETLALRRAKLGPDHPDTLMSMNNLANSYDDAGQTDRAPKLFGGDAGFAKGKARRGPSRHALQHKQPGH